MADFFQRKVIGNNPRMVVVVFIDIHFHIDSIFIMNVYKHGSIVLFKPIFVLK